MPNRPRPRRVAISGARMRFANTVADLMNVSRTGALIRLNYRLRTGGEWPMVLELPRGRAVWLNGHVVRCDRVGVRPPGRGEPGNQYMLGLSFVEPSHEALAVLDTVCGTPPRTAPSMTAPFPFTPRRLLVPLVRVWRISLSLERRCPECRSVDIAKDVRHQYSCEQCGRRFAGYRLGPLRLSI